MLKIICLYVNIIDCLCIKIGRVTMYMVFVMMFVLVLSFVTRNIINIPLMWIIEMAQFIITGYYLLGGGYSMVMGDHVRMDLVYSKLSERNKAKMDAFTSFFLVFYFTFIFRKWESDHNGDVQNHLFRSAELLIRSRRMWTTYGPSRPR